MVDVVIDAHLAEVSVCVHGTLLSLEDKAQSRIWEDEIRSVGLALAIQATEAIGRYSHRPPRDNCL